MYKFSYSLPDIRNYLLIPIPYPISEILYVSVTSQRLCNRFAWLLIRNKVRH